MLLQELVRTSAAVAATRSRLAKRAALAELLQRAEAAEIGLVVTYVSGAIRQRRTGLGWATLSELPDPASNPSLEIAAVDAAFEEIAGEAGSGSAQRRSAATAALFGAATEPEQAFLRAIVFGELRQGASSAQVVDALAAAFAVPLPVVQRAVMLLGSPAVAAELLAREGIEALERVHLQVGVPVQPMLAASAPDTAQAFTKAGGGPVVVDAKLDGIRLQIHRRGAEVRTWTRSLDDITDRLPEIVAQVAALPGGDLVLDGEVVGLGVDGRPLPFQQISARTASSVDVAELQRKVPLRLFAFDLLHVDGTDLLDEPLSTRLERLGVLLPADSVVPRLVTDDPDRIQEFFTAVVADGWEGVVVKKPDAPYAAGRRDSGWIKVKPRHTFDLAVIAAEWGYGRRQGWLSNIHLAARGADGELVMLGKTFKGMTDAMLTRQTEQFLAREARRTKTTVFVDPPLVAEIALDGIQRSTRYPGGIALRFARVLRYRDDKTVAEVDTLADVLALSPFVDDESSSPEQE